MNNEITETLIQEAKNNPNGWVYKIDNGYDTIGDISPQAIVGAWKVNEQRYIIGEFISNPNYVPFSESI